MLTFFGRRQDSASNVKPSNSSTLQKETTAPNLTEAQMIEKGRRLISSVVVSEEYVTPPPEMSEAVRYVEVPMVQEVVVRVPKHSMKEIEKPVPKYEVEYVDRVVEVPQVVYVDNVVEVPVVKEEIREVPVKQVKEIPIEVIKTVPRVEYKNVEKIVYVEGEVIEVPKPYPVEKTVEVKQYKDKQVPVVVAQTVQPLVTISNKTVEIPSIQYEPEVIHVDIRVPKPVKTSLIQAGTSEHVPQQPVKVPAAQYNTLLKLLNKDLSIEEQQLLPYLRENDTIPFLKEDEAPPVMILSNPNDLHRTMQYDIKGASLRQQPTGLFSRAASCWIGGPRSIFPQFQCCLPETKSTKTPKNYAVNIPQYPLPTSVDRISKLNCNSIKKDKKRSLFGC